MQIQLQLVAQQRAERLALPDPVREVHGHPGPGTRQVDRAGGVVLAAVCEVRRPQDCGRRCLGRWRERARSRRAARPPTAAPSSLRLTGPGRRPRAAVGRRSPRPPSRPTSRPWLPKRASGPACLRPRSRPTRSSDASRGRGSRGAELPARPRTAVANVPSAASVSSRVRRLSTYWAGLRHNHSAVGRVPVTVGSGVESRPGNVVTGVKPPPGRGSGRPASPAAVLWSASR